LPQHPALLVFHPFEEEFSEGVYRRFTGEAIINVLVIRIRFEPEFVGVEKEQQAEKQENDDKSERWLVHFRLKVGKFKGLNV
jgi:hypothetical protein